MVALFVEGYIPKMRNVCIAVLLIALLIAVGSYQAYIDTVVSYLHMN